MAYCFYNGVKLPELPSEMLANYPYCWIRKNGNTEHYDLILTKVLGYYDATASGIVYGANQGTTEIAHYRVAYSSASTSDNWDSYQTTETWMALDTNRTVMWSNHYIPNGSLTATVMYFDGSEAIPETESYEIQKDTMVAIADQVRRLCKTEATMTPAQMESNLGGLNIDLMETYVTSTTEDQVIYPDEGYYGFSKITVGAVDFGSGDSGGGGGGSGGDTGTDEYVSSDNVTFGAEFIKLPPPPVDDGYEYYIIYTSIDGNTYLSTSPFSFFVSPNLHGAHYDTNVTNSYNGNLYTWNGGWGTPKTNYWPVAVECETGDHDNCGTILFTSHNIHNGGEEWMEATAAESGSTLITIEKPLERNETYTIDGNKMTDLILTAQKITGTNKPMTPNEAIEVMDEYYANPAEGRKW